jgi:uncharacterized protein (DUF952 family)
MIYHAARVPEWDDAKLHESRLYVPAGFATEGFIHCSTAGQLEAAVNRFLGDEPELVLVELDETALDDLRWEPGSRGEAELFPHLHAPISRADVRSTHRWRRGDDGFRVRDVAIDPH